MVGEKNPEHSNEGGEQQLQRRLYSTDHEAFGCFLSVFQYHVWWLENEQYLSDPGVRDITSLSRGQRQLDCKAQPSSAAGYNSLWQA